MKKILPILLLAIAFAGCEKEPEGPYTDAPFDNNIIGLWIPVLKEDHRVPTYDNLYEFFPDKTYQTKYAAFSDQDEYIIRYDKGSGRHMVSDKRKIKFSLILYAPEMQQAWAPDQVWILEHPYSEWIDLFPVLKLTQDSLITGIKKTDGEVIIHKKFYKSTTPAQP